MSLARSKGPRSWSEEEEVSLIHGVRAMGIGSWEVIRADPDFRLSHRSALQLKDKWRNLVKYKHVEISQFPAMSTVLCKRRQVELCSNNDAETVVDDPPLKRPHHDPTASSTCTRTSTGPTAVHHAAKSTIDMLRFGCEASDDCADSGRNKLKPLGHPPSPSCLLPRPSHSDDHSEEQYTPFSETKVPFSPEDYPEDLRPAVKAAIARVRKAKARCAISLHVQKQSNDMLDSALRTACVESPGAKAIQNLRRAKSIAEAAHKDAVQSRAALEREIETLWKLHKKGHGVIPDSRCKKPSHIEMTHHEEHLKISAIDNAAEDDQAPPPTHPQKSAETNASTHQPLESSTPTGCTSAAGYTNCEAVSKHIEHSHATTSPFDIHTDDWELLLLDPVV